MLFLITVKCFIFESMLLETLKIAATFVQNSNITVQWITVMIRLSTILMKVSFQMILLFLWLILIFFSDPWLLQFTSKSNWWKPRNWQFLHRNWRCWNPYQKNKESDKLSIQSLWSSRSLQSECHSFMLERHRCWLWRMQLHCIWIFYFYYPDFGAGHTRGKLYHSFCHGTILQKENSKI